MALWQPIDPPVWERAGGIASNQEVYDRAQRAASYVDNINSRVEAWEAVYDRQIDDLAALTGTRLENPFRERSPDLPLEITIPGGIQRMQPGEVVGEMQALQASASARARYASQLAELRAANPSATLKITEIDEEAVNRFIRGVENEFVEAYQSRVDLPGTDFATLGITLGAGILGMLRDPIQAPLLLLGAGAGAARTIAGKILAVAGREAVIGGVSEAALQPFIQRNRAIAGLPHGFRQALINVAFATAGGAVFGGTFRGVAESFTAVRNMIRPSRAANVAPAVRAAETVEAPPEVRGAIDALENEVNFAAARPDAVDADAHDRAMSAAIRGAEDPTQLAAARAEIDEGIGNIAFVYEMRRAIERSLIDMDMAAARAAPPARTEDAVGNIEAAPETQTVRAAQAVAEAPQGERAVPEPEARQPSPARPVAPPRRAANIVDFLIEQGGLRPHADLAAIGADRLFRPGKGKLVRKAGTKGALDLDYAREAAAQAGYFGGDTVSAVSRTTPTDLLDLLDDAIRGKEAIPETADALSRSAESQALEGRAAYLDRIEGEISAYMQAAEIDDRRWLRLAVQVAEQSGRGPNLTDGQIDDIMERAAIMMAPAATRRAIRDDIPFDPDTEGQPTRSAQERRSQGREDRRQAERAAVPDAGRDQGPPAPELGRRASDTFEDADAVAQADELERTLRDRGFEERGGQFDLATPGFRSVKIGDTTIGYTVRDGTVRVDNVTTAADRRRQGSARRTMEQLVREADAVGLRLTLTPEPIGKGSRARLEAFYRSLGFKPNKGRSKDFTTQDAMIREPRAGFEQRDKRDDLTGDIFARPTRVMPTPTTRPAGKEPTRHVDLGEWDHDPSGPLGIQAQDYVLGLGREHGVEYMVALNGAGEVMAHGYGTFSGTGMTEHLWQAVNKPGSRVVVHHNHPSGSTLSTTDLSFLPLIGQESVWAHGSTGRSFHAMLTPEARVAFNRAFGTTNPESRMSAMRVAADAARDGLYRELREVAAVNPKLITVMAESMQELINAAMDAAGIIIYRSDGVIDRAIDANGWRPHVEAAAADARKVIFRGEQLPARVDRRAEPLRHIGDMGAVFSRPEGAAGRNLEQGGPDRVGKQDARSEGGTGFREDGDPGLELEDGTTLRAALAAATHTKFVSSLVEACRLR